MPTDDLDRVPFPVAFPMHAAREPDLGATDRRDNALFAFDQAARLTALLLLSDYLQQDEIDSRLSHQIRKLVFPFLGDWMQIASALAGFWSEEGRRSLAMFPELAQAWRAVVRAKGAPPDPALNRMAAQFPGNGGAGQARSAGEALQALRNARGHRGGTVTSADTTDREAAATQALALAGAVVQRLFGAGHFDLIRAVRLPGQPMRVIQLTGPHPELQFTPSVPNPAWEEGLAPTDVLTVAGTRSIPVFPMVLPTHDENATPLFGLEDPAAMIEKVSSRQLTLIGVRKFAHVPRNHAHMEAALAALKGKNVDPVLDRKETTPWEVASWSRHTAAVTLDTLLAGKYFPAFYLERRGVDDALARLAGQPGGALLLLGEAGSGKSSLVARLAEHRIGADWTGDPTDRPETNDIVAWLAGRGDYAGPVAASADQVLVQALSRKLGVGPDQFHSLATLLHHLEGHRGTDLHPDRLIWLLLDGLNEADRFKDVVTELDAFLPELAHLPRVRLVVTIRRGAFQALAAQGALLGRSGPAVFSNIAAFQTFREGEQERPWLSVRPFRLEDEGEQAYRKRQTALPGRAASLPWSALDEPTRRLLLRPLYLHLFHIQYANAPTAPRALTEAGLLDLYLDSLEDTEGLGESLGRLARLMLESRSAELPITVAESWRQEWLERTGFRTVQGASKLDPVEELVSAEVLLRPLEEGFGAARERIGYGFVQQKLAERLLVRLLDRSLPPDRIPSEAEWRRRLAEAQAMPPFPELVGALSNWAERLTLAQHGEALSALLEMGDDVSRDMLLQASLAATTVMPTQAAQVVLSALSDRAAAIGAGRTRWLYPGWKLADRLVELGRTAGAWQIGTALRAYAQQAANDPQKSDLDSAEAKRDLSISCNKYGDLALRLGDGSTAQHWFQHGFDVIEILAQADPDAGSVKRDLSGSCERLGDIALQLGDSSAAQYWFQRTFNIREALAQADPNSKLAKRDLSISCSRLGDLALRVGDGPATQRWLKRSLDINVELAQADSDSAQAKRDVSVSCDKLGELALWLGDGSEAKYWFQRSLDIAEALAQADPESALAKRELSVSCDKLGDLALGSGDDLAAQNLFRRSLEIDEALAQADPDSAQAKRDLSVSSIRLGDLALRLRDGKAAERWFQRSVEIHEALAQADPNNAQAKRDLSVSRSKLGELALWLGDGPAAQRWFQRSLEIREALAQADPDGAEAKRDLSVSYSRLGQAQLAAGERAQAAGLLTRARESVLAQMTSSPDDASLTQLLTGIDALLDQCVEGEES